MSQFHQKCLEHPISVWDKILNHDFLTMTAEGNIPDKTFKIWMQQDYLFVRDSIPFVAILLAKSPVQYRSNFVQILSVLDQELGLFRKNAEAHGVDLKNIIPSPTCEAYNQYLMNVAYRGSFVEGFTALYAAEKAYLDSWMQVKNHQKAESPWQEFINNWTSQEFQQYVEWLATTLDELVEGKSESELEDLKELFLKIAKYEYLFWEMAVKEEEWPV